MPPVTRSTPETLAGRCVRPGLLLLAAAMLLEAGAQPAHAFGTVNLLGQHAEHERITRLGLASLGLGARTMAAVAGGRGSFGAVGAPDRPDRGLMGQTSAHCDGGDTLPVPGYPQDAAQAMATLEACRAWIFRHLREAVEEAGALADAAGRIDRSQVPTLVPCIFNGSKGRAKCNVIESLGLALHAAQDFYSHSNWVDRAGPGEIGPRNPPGLGNTGRSPWLDPRVAAAAPAGLISGCFEGIPEGRHCQQRVRHRDLNKDTGEINVQTGAIQKGTTSRGAGYDNFVRAVRAAIDDTRDKWAYFEERVLASYGEARGRAIICAMRRDDPAGC